MHMRDTIYVYVLNKKHDLHLQIWLMFTFDMTQRHDLNDTCTRDMTDSACVICLIDMTDTIHTRIYRENRASSKTTRPFLMG